MDTISITEERNFRLRQRIAEAERQQAQQTAANLEAMRAELADLERQQALADDIADLEAQYAEAKVRHREAVAERDQHVRSKQYELARLDIDEIERPVTGTQAALDSASYWLASKRAERDGKLKDPATARSGTEGNLIEQDNHKFVVRPAQAAILADDGFIQDHLTPPINASPAVIKLIYGEQLQPLRAVGLPADRGVRGLGGESA